MPYKDITKRREVNARWHRGLENGISATMDEVLAVLSGEWLSITDVADRYNGQRPTLTLWALHDRGLVEWKNTGVECWRRASNQDRDPAKERS